MKKIGFFIKTIYKIRVIKPGNQGNLIRITHHDEGNFEAMVRNAIATDTEMPDLDMAMQKMLEERVARKNMPRLSRNSIADFFMPLLTFRNIELKMAAITIALLMLLRIGPVVNHSVNKSVQPAILADTLVDSSFLHMYLRDSSLP